MSNSEGISAAEKRPAGRESQDEDGAVYTLHPFGDEWLWDRDDDTKPLTVSKTQAVEVAQNHRANYLRTDDEEKRRLAVGMWFTLMSFDIDDPERVPEHIAALIGPDGTLYDYDDPRCLFLYDGIGSDGEWPTPYADDVILLCANCGQPMVCQNASHIRKIGVRNPDTGELEEREPTAEEREERQPKQGERSHFSCGPVRSSGGGDIDRRGWGEVVR